MKYFLSVLLFTFLTLDCVSQIVFEKGYFIDNSGKKTECLIRNSDWKDNPTKIHYKVSENLESQVAKLDSIIEFGIYGQCKFIKSKVQIDRSSELTDEITSERNPEFKEEQLFLKVLLEGKANLYLYVDVNLVRFFYKTDTSAIEQLVYKLFKNSTNKIVANSTYIYQLSQLTELGFLISELSDLNYNEKELLGFFIKYNQAPDVKVVQYKKTKTKDYYYLNLRPGINYSNLFMTNHRSLHFQFPNVTTFRIGAEFEVVFPFNKNKWSIFLEPTYQYYKTDLYAYTDNWKVDYKSLEIPVGVRYNIFLNDHSSIFLNCGFVLDIPIKSSITTDEKHGLDIEKSNSLGIGLGYKYRKSYSVELRYISGRDLFTNYIEWSSTYRTFSVILGYSILKPRAIKHQEQLSTNQN